MYQLLIDNWGNIEAFTTGDWLLAADPMVAGVVAFMVQLFFAWRLHIIAQQRWLTMFIIVMSFATVCGGIGTGIAVLWVKSYARFADFQQIAVIWLISAAVGDISITTALTFHLRRRRGTFKATDRLLNRIIQRKFASFVNLSCCGSLRYYSHSAKWFADSSRCFGRYLFIFIHCMSIFLCLFVKLMTRVFSPNLITYVSFTVTIDCDPCLFLPSTLVFDAQALFQHGSLFA